LIQSDPGYSVAHWQTFAELGWLCVPFSEDDGGIGGGPVDIMILMEQFGQGLVVEPYLSSVVLAGGALAKAGNATQKAAWLAPIIDGSALASLAYVEPQSRYNLADVATRAEADGSGYRLSGKKCFVLHGDSAQHLVVSARSAGAQTDAQGISLFVVPVQAEGVSVVAARTLDGQRIAEITFANVAVSADQCLGESGAGLAVLEAVISEGLLAVCAEAVGMMEKLYKDTVEYTKTRKQFGVAISHFQALQHRMVDMFTEYEQCKSLLLRAVLSYAADESDAQRNLSALKQMISGSAQRVAHEAVQIHGGMGMTDEMSVGMYLKRINVINTLFGNGDYHLRRFIALS
jgi:alkylation response protein AidB-like acyl-CoA dehydrogenase